MIDPAALKAAIDEAEGDFVVLHKSDAVQLAYDLRIGRSAAETLVNLRSIINAITPSSLGAGIGRASPV